jgi:predicted DNA-binding transcriptional regulator AlpA
MSREKQMTEADEFLTDAQLCALLHVNPRTTMRWRRDGNGPPFVRCGARRVLYFRADIETWRTTRTFCHRAAEAAGGVS